MPAALAAHQTCSVVSDGHVYVAIYNMATGGTEDSADAWNSATVSYTKANNTWFGAYVYDYDSAAWVQALHIYHQDL